MDKAGKEAAVIVTLVDNDGDYDLVPGVSMPVNAVLATQ